MKTANDIEVISRSPDVMSGAAVFAETRVPAQTFIYLAGGHPLEDFLDDFPTVSREQAIELLSHMKEMHQVCPPQILKTFAQAKSGASKHRDARARLRFSRDQHRVAVI